MLVGYARVSTPDQNLDLQRDALRVAGCERLFEEHASGASARLPGRAELLDYARPSNVLVVWRLVRLGRSLRDLVETASGLGERGVGLRSLHEAIDTTSPTGKLTFHIFAALRMTRNSKPNSGENEPGPASKRPVLAARGSVGRPHSTLGWSRWPAR